jgi:hypothetical protein
MSYIQSTGTDALSVATVELLATLAGFAVPPTDLPTLAAALTEQLASIERLDRLNLEDVSPVLDFDPRWR